VTARASRAALVAGAAALAGVALVRHRSRPHPSEPPPASPDDVFARAVDRNFVARLALEVAATLGLVDQVLAGTHEIAELALQCEADPDALIRLLRLLQLSGIVRVNEDARSVEVTEAGALLSASDSRLWRARLDQRGMGRRMDEAVFHGLLTSIRTGAPSYQQVHGRGFWDDVRALDLAGSFQSHMAPHAIDLASDIAALPELAAASSVVDLGGGDGALLQAVLEANPHLRGSLLELPEVAAVARQRFAGGEVARRVSIIDGDVFKTHVAPHDVCLLSWVLHDWPDAEARLILAAGAAALGPGGRLVVIERPRVESLEVLEADLRMLVFFGGRERSEQEWRELFVDAGLSVVHATPVGSGPFVAYCLER
jgi:2,7-dihydroxy-5-methyl-1-naphthoate 7-O-methyltransferase